MRPDPRDSVWRRPVYSLAKLNTMKTFVFKPYLKQKLVGVHGLVYGFAKSLKSLPIVSEIARFDREARSIGGGGVYIEPLAVLSFCILVTQLIEFSRSILLEILPEVRELCLK